MGDQQRAMQAQQREIMQSGGGAWGGGHAWMTVRTTGRTIAIMDTTMSAAEWMASDTSAELPVSQPAAPLTPVNMKSDSRPTETTVRAARCCSGPDDAGRRAWPCE